MPTINAAAGTYSVRGAPSLNDTEEVMSKGAYGLSGNPVALTKTGKKPHGNPHRNKVQRR